MPSLEEQPPGREASDTRGPRRSATAWLAVAVLSAITVAALYISVREEPQAATPAPLAPPVASSSPRPLDSAAPDPAAAADLRQRAFGECDAKQWKDCFVDLQKAAHLDPAGDTDPKVRAARTAAFRGIQAGK